MSSDHWDIVVLGGGIQGVGVAQAGAAAGYRVLLLEKTRVACGTSSRSSKLIHGGLRYLESAQFSLVRESLSERAILLEIAPHLVDLVPFYIPVYRSTVRRPWQIRVGLSMYAVLGGLVNDARFARVPRADWGELDGLRTDGLRAVFRYFDGQTDDAALTRAVLASARELGADFVCPASFTRAERDEDGYRVHYEFDGRQEQCRATALVNATGPWIAEVQRRIEPEPERIGVELVGGTHILLDGELRRGVYYTEAPSDHRAVFAIPWKKGVMVGTTEKPFHGAPQDVEPTQEEIDYLLETYAHYFPERTDELRGSFAGLRVLPAGPGNAFSRPRDVTLATDDDTRPHLVAIYGGKLTGYRATAVKVLERLERTLPERERRADTATLRLPSE